MQPADEANQKERGGAPKSKYKKGTMLDRRCSLLPLTVPCVWLGRRKPVPPRLHCMTSCRGIGTVGTLVNHSSLVLLGRRPGPLLQCGDFHKLGTCSGVLRRRWYRTLLLTFPVPMLLFVSSLCWAKTYICLPPQVDMMPLLTKYLCSDLFSFLGQWQMLCCPRRVHRYVDALAISSGLNW